MLDLLSRNDAGPAGHATAAGFESPSRQWREFFMKPVLDFSPEKIKGLYGQVGVRRQQASRVATSNFAPPIEEVRHNRLVISFQAHKRIVAPSVGHRKICLRIADAADAGDGASHKKCAAQIGRKEISSADNPPFCLPMYSLGAAVTKPRLHASY